MSYDPIYRNLPQDMRPMGTNNLNQLVHHHLGSESFDVVAQIRANLPWLHDLATKIHVISALAHHADNLDKIGANSTVIYALAESMPALKDIYCHLDNLVALSKVGTSINAKVTKIENELSALNGQVSQAAIDDLLKRYAEVENKLSGSEGLVNSLPVIQKDMVQLNKTVAHLLAANATTTAMVTEKTSDINAARKLIEQSEALGNNETVNTQRLDNL